MVRRAVEPSALAAAVRTAFGSQRRPVRVERLRGGSKKGVYRVTLDDASTLAAYVWDPQENYWPASGSGAGNENEDPFSEASGAYLFETSHAQLSALGVRTPEVYLLDRNRAPLPDIALVQDLPGGTLETQLETDPITGARSLAELRTMLQSMHRYTAPHFGKISSPASGIAEARSCQQVVLERAMRHLSEAAVRLESLAAVEAQLADLARELAGAVRPRATYGTIHGELGPDHVLIDDEGHPVLIDIEGLMFFDVEWEHAFLQIRFHQNYAALQTTELDQERLTFYRLALVLSLVAGPLRLLDGDFPDRDAMQRIVARNLERVFEFLR